MITTLRAFWLVLALCVLAPRALAQDREGDGPSSAAESRATTFQPVEGPLREDIAGGPLLLAAYGLVLAFLFGYVVRLGALQQRTARELAQLRAQIERNKN